MTFPCSLLGRAPRCSALEHLPDTPQPLARALSDPSRPRPRRDLLSLTRILSRVGLLSHGDPVMSGLPPSIDEPDSHRDGSSKRRREWLLHLCVLVVIVAVITALLSIPVPQTFSLQGVTVGDLTLIPCSNIHPSQGTVVSFHWSAPSPTNFGVYACTESSNVAIYTGNGTSGSGTFTANGGLYAFGQGCNVLLCGPNANVTGSYTGPLLAL